VRGGALKERLAENAPVEHIALLYAQLYHQEKQEARMLEALDQLPESECIAFLIHKEKYEHAYLRLTKQGTHSPSR
jgi:hypothetical protein